MKTKMKMSDDERLREKVKQMLIECRVERDLTQTDVGKIVGKSKNAVASWEQGLSLPDVVTLFKLANYYGKSMDYMYGENDDSNIREG